MHVIFVRQWGLLQDYLTFIYCGIEFMHDNEFKFAVGITKCISYENTRTSYHCHNCLFSNMSKLRLQITEYIEINCELVYSVEFRYPHIQILQDEICYDILIFCK